MGIMILGAAISALFGGAVNLVIALANRRADLRLRQRDAHAGRVRVIADSLSETVSAMIAMLREDAALQPADAIERHGESLTRDIERIRPLLDDARLSVLAGHLDQARHQDCWGKGQEALARWHALRNFLADL